MKRIIQFLTLSSLAYAGCLTPLMSADSDFPYSDLIPKEETGVARFLKEHPEFDGRGVVVAIFDTGVDPGAAGLQTTTDGRPKIIDMVDASGSGDVDTSKVVKAEKGRIEGLTGRKLKLDEDWKNPTGKYHVGMKPAYELFPAKLVSRVKAKRKKDWDKEQRALLMKERQVLADFEESHPKPNDAQKKEKEELENRVKQLVALQKGYKDPGPIHDCVVFHDGMVWRAVIDTDEDGDLTDEKLMTNYRLEGQWSTFGQYDLMNFAVNIYEEGDLLSIVADCGAHGTHVASIVAAHVPDRPELNGVAPGAQIVAVKIGDTRMGSSSMGTGSVRGLIAVEQNNCDLINMSYGGATSEPNAGRVAGLYSEIVNKHGVIFVASAGNNGPALSTVGSPGGTTSAIFGIGAYVSPDMMEAQYSLLKGHEENNYTWSSRGPTLDGDLGVDFCAPGGAVASVSNWTLQKSMLMNGTSMSSPNACGGIALLLSGLKAEGIAFTPNRVKRAVSNTCRVIDGVEVFAQGRGLVQIDKAYEYLRENKGFSDDDLSFEVTVPNRNKARGIYLRESFETTEETLHRVDVEAVFHEDAPSKDKVSFEMHLDLETTENWLSAPEHLVLMHGGRYFDVAVDPAGLEAGVHYAEVHAMDASNPGRGPVFRVPVTVVIAHDPDRVSTSFETSLDNGGLTRRFVDVPSGAQWADVFVTASGFENPRRVVLHTVQSVPGSSFRSFENRSYLTLVGGEEKAISLRVEAGRTMELVLAQYWSTDGRGQYDVRVRFRGLQPSSDALAFNGHDSVERLDVTSFLGDETLAPSVSFKAVRKHFKPSDHEIRALDPDRDMLPDERLIQEVVNTYKFSLDAKATVEFRFDLNDEWESKLWALYDNNKRLVDHGSSGKSESLEKGSYVLKFHARHDDRSRLEQLKQLPMMLDRKLSKSISVSAYPTRTDALTDGRKLTSSTLEKGDQRAVWFSVPERKELPKFAEAGDVLVGNYTLCSQDGGLPGGSKRPGGYTALMTVPVADASKPGSSDSGGSKEKKSEQDKFKEHMRDAMIEQLKRWKGDKNSKDFANLYKRLIKDWPDNMEVRMVRLEKIDADNARKKNIDAIIELCDEMIGLIDRDALQKHYGMRIPEGDKDLEKKRKEMDKKRDQLADLLYRKGRAIAYGETIIKEHQEASEKKESDETEKKDNHPIPTLGENAFEDNYAELQRWVDVNDSKYILLKIRNERRQERYATALDILQGQMSKATPSRKLHDKRIKILKSIGWEDWAKHEETWNLLRYRPHYLPF